MAKNPPYSLEKGEFGYNVVELNGSMPRIIGKFFYIGKSTVYIHLSDENVPFCQRENGKRFRVSPLESIAIFGNDILYFPTGRRSDIHFRIKYFYEPHAEHQLSIN